MARQLARIGIVVGGLLSTVFLGTPGTPALATIEHGTEVCFSADRGPASASGVGSLALVNLTPVDASAPGHGVLATSAADVPLASNVNFGPGTVDPNVAAAVVSGNAEVCFIAGPTADLELAADPLFLLPPGAFASNGPHRVVDTRAGLGGDRLERGEHRCFPVAGSPGDVAAVNLTPVLADGPGHGRLVSSDDTSNIATSNVNYRPGTTDPNVALARIGSDGRLCYVNSDHSAVDLVADELFRMVGDTASATVPTRVADTRAGLAGTTLTAGEQRCFAVDGEAGELAVLNVTPVNVSAAGFGSLTRSLASGVDPATVVSINASGSDVNFAPGTVDPNLAAEVIGTDGRICFQNSHHGSVDLVADHVATIASQSWQPAGGRFDTRFDSLTMETCLADGSCLAVADGAEIVRRPAGTDRWYHQSFPGLDTPVNKLACDIDLCWVDSAPWGSSPAAGTLGDRHWISHDGGLTWIERPEELTTLACPTDAVCLGVGTWVSTYGLSGGPSAGVTVDSSAFLSIDLAGVEPPLEGWSCGTVTSTGCDRPDTLFTSLACPTSERCVAGYWSGTPVEFSTSDGWMTIDVARAD